MSDITFFCKNVLSKISVAYTISDDDDVILE